MSDSSPGDVRIRDVDDGDLEALFEHQLDPEATQMAGFPSRERDAFMAHWARIRSDPTTINQTIIVDGEVAGYIGSWEQSGKRKIGYWLGRQYWGRGIATSGLRLFLGQLNVRPLYADVVQHNIGSQRVLEKCGFRRLLESEADADDEVTFILEA